MRNPDLTLCSLAMLAVIVDRISGTSASDLAEAVPHEARRDLLPGEIESWPHDVSEWFDELQALLDAGLVERVAGDHKYLYEPTERGRLVATERGEIVLRAALHPRGASLESVA